MIDDLIILCGDALDQLKPLGDESIQCCVSSPPYWSLRDYQVEGQLGQEKSPEEYVTRVVEVLREVKRVLKPDGTLWLNLGDSYASSWPCPRRNIMGNGSLLSGKRENRPPRMGVNLKNKDLIGIPWMVGFALRADGWYLRQQIPWIKRNSMPESTRDRPVSSCETIFLLSKSANYFYDYDAVKLPASESFLNDSRWKTGSTDKNEKNGYAEAGAQNPKKLHRMFDKQGGHSRRHQGFNDRWDKMEKSEQCKGWRSTRNSDWFFEGLMSNEEDEPLAIVVSPTPYREAHFATFPANLVRPLILAGSKYGDTILDPFAGSGTTGMVAMQLGRKAILIELNPDYIKLIEKRCSNVQSPLELGT